MSKKVFHLSILYLSACDTYLAMLSVFFATVNGITYLCVLKLSRILKCLRFFFAIFQFESSVCSTELKLALQ